MDNTKKLQEFIQSLSSEIPKVIAVPVELIHFTGNASKAVLLAQLIYWSGKGKRPDGLIWKSYAKIYEETGIKQKTCSRYYDEFREMGFFNWKQKLAMGKNVVHYKLDMDKLTESIKTYWLSRDRQNIQSEIDKMSDSITENTTQITSIDNTLSHTIKGESDFGSNSSKVDSIDNNNQLDFTDVLTNAGFCEEVAAPLSTNFEPSLENQFWAVTNFESKFVSLVTESFSNYFLNLPNSKKTLSGWQMEWRKWMGTERVIYGYDEYMLEREHNEIIKNCKRVIYQFTQKAHHRMLHIDELHSLLRTEEYDFSEGTIDHFLGELEADGNLVKYFGNYFYSQYEARNGKRYRNPHNLFSCWASIDDSLANFIRERNPVTREQLRENFPNYCQTSVDACIESGVKSGMLTEENGSYWDTDNCPDWFGSVEFSPNVDELLVA